jgi:hypothetical protein
MRSNILTHGRNITYYFDTFALLGCYAALVVTEVSERPIYPMFKGQPIQEDCFFDCLALEDGTASPSRNGADNPFRNVGNQLPTKAT